MNFDDPLVRKMEEKTKARIFFYGLSAESDLWADQVEGLGLDGIRFRLHYQREIMHVHIPMIGRHSVETALRAAAVGLVEGLNWQEILHGLRQGNSQLRLVAVRTETGAVMLDDTYNASPESMMASLNLLSELEGQRKIAVLGDMLELGPYEQQGHEMVGPACRTSCRYSGNFWAARPYVCKRCPPCGHESHPGYRIRGERRHH